jgi:hypothetical protein
MNKNITNECPCRDTVGFERLYANGKQGGVCVSEGLPGGDACDDLDRQVERVE